MDLNFQVFGVDGLGRISLPAFLRHAESWGSCIRCILPWWKHARCVPPKGHCERQFLKAPQALCSSQALDPCGVAKFGRPSTHDKLYRPSSLQDPSTLNLNLNPHSFDPNPQTTALLGIILYLYVFRNKGNIEHVYYLSGFVCVVSSTPEA